MTMTTNATTNATTNLGAASSASTGPMTGSGTGVGSADGLMQSLTQGIHQAMDAAIAQTLASLPQAAPQGSFGVPSMVPGAGPFTAKATPPFAPIPATLRTDEESRGGFTNFGDFAQAVKSACHPSGRVDDRLSRLMAKAPSGLGTSVGSDGGFLVPMEFSRRIFQRILSGPSLLAMTDSYTVAGNTLTFPRSSESSRANGSRHGGVRGYWLEEGGAIAPSKPGFGRLRLSLHKIAVLIHVTDELLSDAAGNALDQYLSRVGGDEIRFLVGDAIIRGTGTGQPLGLLNAPATITVPKESGQAAATITTENVLKMWSRLYAPCRPNAVWFHNQDIEPQLWAMRMNVGSGGQPVYLPPGGLSERPYATLMGRPLMPVEWCSTLGTAGDLILADLSQYVTISRGAVESAMSMHLRFDYDETAFRLIFRMDGQPWWAAPLTPYQGTQTQSCFVTLQNRA
ncbi:phage major capsid protein [Tuwongella immobilis]|uniref:Phage capsid-like C-terminal domain-containing protein n=1 Tax=Tuwongella immobilis TaxID=692036 RepID=A0A6C2YGP1_9BACT|nr:phage major capsid protein [Tuwongella immobilis]VIP00690.1 Phage capsid family protein OS=Desulfosporosinus acidiphilus (strain DSM 22704 / JCM 16185 / SJ4) GN=Desaci_1301 PE=4 SV=1: Phage_capsid [Tuwongella immobilis]VTR96798.1 Phage capsid family protein OS=Desulfosporosinus acidiphilus (strain DSM 22704 / JCM 16185 / SJ4) GN=Desaci_1301 PE=4 SV=1: Phage_capsid [Tuwongella immobilis]